MKWLVFVTVVAAGLLSKAYACSCDCGDKCSPEDTAARMETIFRGVYLGSSATDEVVFGPLRKAKFRVVETLKGHVGRKASVFFEAGVSSQCGMQFTKGLEYDVFALRHDKNRLYTSTCDGTRRHDPISWERFRDATRSDDD